MDGRSEGPLTVDNYVRRWTSKLKDIRSRCRRMSLRNIPQLLALTARCNVGELTTISMLTDDVLLETYNFYVIEGFRLLSRRRIEGSRWQMLAHVCRRWRSVVFQSPQRLNLRLFCTPQTRVRDILDVWPTLPLIVHNSSSSSVEDQR
jgi:hypothetical protein